MWGWSWGPIYTDTNTPETRGQGRFKQNVYRIEKECRITRVRRLEHLQASHILPWRDCPTNESRLDGENGLLLTPTIDHLFDRGLISFEDDGRLLVSPVAHRDSLRRMGIPEPGSRSYPPFTAGQRRNLELHRDAVFLEAFRRACLLAILRRARGVIRRGISRAKTLAGSARG